MATVLVIQNEASDPPGLVGKWLEESGIHLEIVRPYAGDAVPRAVPHDVHGVVVLGGSMGANDDAKYSWLAEVKALLSDAVLNETPVLGLCLGGQLLAVALGGRVESAPNVEIGVTEVHVTPQAATDRLFGNGIPSTLKAVQWHQDYISELPNEAVCLVTSAQCAVQAFRFGASAYGFQFHPEVDVDIFSSWFVAGDEVMLKATKSQAELVDQVQQAVPQLIQTWKPVVQRWVTEL